MSIERSEYPICPRCGSPVAGALMTSKSISVVKANGEWGKILFYHPDAISLYCVSGSCNFDHNIADFTTPVPEEEW